MNKLLDYLFIKLLKWYCSNRLDQWDKWKYDSKFGVVYIDISRVPDGHEYLELK